VSPPPGQPVLQSSAAKLTAAKERRGGDAWLGTSLPAQGESVSPRERRCESVGSRRNGGMRRFRDHAITEVPPRARGGTVVRIWRLPPDLGWGGLRFREAASVNHLSQAMMSRIGDPP